MGACNWYGLVDGFRWYIDGGILGRAHCANRMGDKEASRTPYGQDFVNYITSS